MTLRLAALAAACGLIAATAGCGPSAEGAKYAKAYPVRGTLKLGDGTPVTGAEVTFWPDAAPTSSSMRTQPFVGSGFTDEKGQFKAGLGASDAGLAPGAYTVFAAPSVTAKPSNTAKKIDGKFRSRETSPVKVTVADSDNSFDIVLK